MSTLDAGQNAGVTPAATPEWLRGLVDNVGRVPDAYRSRVPADVLAAIADANSSATRSGTKRDAAVLVLFSGPQDAPAGGLPEDADLLVTVRASTLRNHSGQAAFPGGAADPEDGGPVGTALREAREETGVDTARLTPLATLDRMFIRPRGSTWCRCWRIRRTPAPSRSSIPRRRPSWRGYRSARSPIRRIG